MNSDDETYDIIECSAQCTSAHAGGATMIIFAKVFAKFIFL